MDQRKKVGELISMNSEKRGIVHIFEDEKLTFGRDEENTNCIPDNRIAYFHCAIFFQDGQVVLKNLCQQGTFLNKQKMGLDMEVNLEHGDHIHLLCQKGKKVTEKHVIAYIFFKQENKKQSARKSSKCRQPVFEQMGDDFICIICSEMYYEGVAVSPCGHVFCGYCLQEWEEKNNTCPICRMKMINITKAFQINRILSTFLELNPEIEQKKKPSNKYYLQVAENNDESDSDISDSDIDSDIEMESDFENEVIRRIQRDQVLRRQFNNIDIANLLALNNRQQQVRQVNQQGVDVNQQPRIPQVEQIQQPQPVNQRVDQPQNNQQNIQQNAQIQQNPQQNAQQNPQQNAQAQNVVVQIAQAQNGQAQIAHAQNGQAQNGQVQNGQAQNGQAQNGQAQNGQAQNGQAQNAQGNQQRANNQPHQQNPQINQQRANNPPPRLNANQQRPPIHAQANQQRVQQPPLQQNAQMNQRRPNVPPGSQINQPRANPHPPLNQPAQQNQQRANPPQPVVAAQQNGQIVHAIPPNAHQNAIAPNPPQNQIVQQRQGRVNINLPPQQIAQAPHRQNQVENNNVRDEVQVQPQQGQANIQIQQPEQPQNQVPQIQPQPQPANENQPQQADINRECRSCHAEYKGFKCLPITNHSWCYCQTTLPIRDLNTHQNADLKLFCQVCKDYFCKFYYGQQCEKEQTININELTSYRDGFNFQNIYFNPIERGRIFRHLDGQDPTIIFDFIMQQYIQKEQFYFQRNKALFENAQNEINELLLPNSPVCTYCIRFVKNQIVFRYVQTYKYEEIQFMMPDCWYGINCKMQNDDMQHAVHFNHICEQTKFD